MKVYAVTNHVNGTKYYLSNEGDPIRKNTLDSRIGLPYNVRPVPKEKVSKWVLQVANSSNNNNIGQVYVGNKPLNIPVLVLYSSTNTKTSKTTNYTSAGKVVNENIANNLKSKIIRTNVRTLNNSNVNKLIKRHSLNKADHVFYRSEFWLKPGTNANYIFGPTITRKIPQSACESRKIKKQIGGTCWFNSILNGWLLSGQGRQIIQHMLNYYKTTPEYKKYNMIQACPMRGKLPLFYFWHYVDNMLKNKNNRINLAFRNSKLIKNLGMRNESSLKGKINLVKELYSLGISNTDIFEILRKQPAATSVSNINMSNNPIMARRIKMGIKVRNATENVVLNTVAAGGYSYEKVAFNKQVFPVMTTAEPQYNMPIYETFKSTSKIPMTKGKYILSHAYIVLREPTSAHAVAGYICDDGKQYIYDSAYNKVYRVDWTDTSKIIPALKDEYGNFKVDIRDTGCTYINKNAISLINENLVPAPAPAPAPAPVPVKKENGNTNTGKKNKQGRTIYKGKRGGLYVIQSGKKVYVRA